VHLVTYSGPGHRDGPVFRTTVACHGHSGPADRSAIAGQNAYVERLIGTINGDVSTSYRQILVTEGDDLDSVGELYAEDDFRQLVVTIETTPAFLGSLGELEVMASAVLFERHPFERTVRWRTVANELSMTLVVRRCFQCSAGNS
jgi:hypothetical protein